MPAHVSANFGVAQRWITAWKASTFVTRKSAISISRVIASTQRIPEETTCSCIAPSLAAPRLPHWRSCDPCRCASMAVPALRHPVPINGGISCDCLTIKPWCRKATPWVTSCVRGGTRLDPKTSGWFPAGIVVRLVCGARSWRCWPASAPSTTCALSGAAPDIPHLRLSTLHQSTGTAVPDEYVYRALGRWC